MLTGGVIEIGSFGILTVGFVFAESAGATLITHGFSMTMYHVQDIKMPQIFWKNTNVYVPDRPLPVTEHGVPVPEADVPHTELGTREGRKGKYPQAREFDGNGNPVRDIDFTDHGTPHKHPNPHQHRRENNPTGGSRTREDAEFLPNWIYL